MRSALETVLSAAAALALSRVPWVVAAIPALGVLRGPLGIVLGVGALALAAAGVSGKARLLGARVAEAPRPLLFGVAFGLLAALGLWYTGRLRVSGDEPHYLLMAQSLWRERDLDLRDNVARQDYLEYTPGPIAPHYGSPRADGRPFPAHSPGLPFLLAPVYAVGGRPACVILLALMGALLSLELHAAARRHTLGSDAALLAWAAALGPPVAFYSFHVYTEVPSALALALTLGRLAPGDRVSVPRAALAAALTSTLPWLHLKMIPAAIVLGLVALVRLRGKNRAAFVIVAAAAGAAYLAYYRSVFGIASPLAIYGGLPAGEGGSPIRALLGLVLDRSFGLLPYAPLFLLAFVGLALLVPRRAWPELTTGAAVLVPVLGWRMWWGGQCPPARFLVPVVPLLALALAVRAATGRGLARWRWPLALGGIVLAGAMAADPGRLFLLNRGDRPTRFWMALSGDVPVERYLPSLASVDPADTRVAIVWVAALTALVVLDAMARRRDRVDRLFRSLALPLVLLLAIGVAVDTWARPSF